MPAFVLREGRVVPIDPYGDDPQPVIGEITQLSWTDLDADSDPEVAVIYHRHSGKWHVELWVYELGSEAIGRMSYRVDHFDDVELRTHGGETNAWRFEEDTDPGTAELLGRMTWESDGLHLITSADGPLPPVVD